VRDIGIERDIARGRFVGAGDRESASSNTMSPSAVEHVSSTFFALASTLSSALTIADMPTAPEREP
jgi:hypothetical protein